jgi:iron complex transport system substrate-binding protein
MMLTPSLWHYLAVEQTGDHLLMLAPFMKREAEDSALGKIFPELGRKPLMAVDRRSSAPFSAEETLMARADLVFVWEYLSQGYERLGVGGLVKIRSDGGDKGAFYEMLGRISAKPERVRRLWDIYGRRMGRFGDAFSPLAAGRPQTLIVLANDSFSLWSDSAFKRFGENLATAGGVNLAGSARPALGPVSLESLLEFDPDVIYLNFHNLSWSTLTIGDLLADPRLAGMRAVRNRRVYHMPMGAMRLEGPVEEPLFMAWMAQTLHPGAGGEIDLRREIGEAYLEAFGYQLSDEDIDGWLRFDENRSAPGHFVFGRHGRPRGGDGR